MTTACQSGLSLTPSMSSPPSVSTRAIFKLPIILKLTDTDSFAAWFVVTEDATADEIRVVRLVLGAISSLPVVALATQDRRDR